MMVCARFGVLVAYRPPLASTYPDADSLFILVGH